jgi:hypothetical protein
VRCEDLRAFADFKEHLQISVLAFERVNRVRWHLKDAEVPAIFVKDVQGCTFDRICRIVFWSVLCLVRIYVNFYLIFSKATAGSRVLLVEGRACPQPGWGSGGAK